MFLIFILISSSLCGVSLFVVCLDIFVLFVIGVFPFVCFSNVYVVPNCVCSSVPFSFYVLFSFCLYVRVVEIQKTCSFLYVNVRKHMCT